MNFVKAHAYGNDFLLVTADAVKGIDDLSVFAKHVCDRHRSVGADGLMVVDVNRNPVRTKLFNADGSYSELSGNGVRCAAAWLVVSHDLPTGASLEIATDAGIKTLTLLARDGYRCRFRAAMGPPQDLRQEQLEVAGETVSAVVMRVGNPQCVVLGPATEDRLRTIAAGLSTHPFFPEGTNVELAEVQHPDRVRILIWERGVGPTEASGTGASAAAVAAAAYGGALRTVEVQSPGGTQRVEWTDAGLWLTGWAEVIANVELLVN